MLPSLKKLVCLKKYLKSSNPYYHILDNFKNWLENEIK